MSVQKVVKIYLDNCCFNRPFDDQNSLRIHLESEAIKAILSLCQHSQWHLIISQITQFEIANTPDDSRRKTLELMIAHAEQTIEINEVIHQRAKILELSGIKAFDAMHLACAETQADVLLTVDDKFLKKAKTLTTLKVDNPLKWLEEVL
jgi:predicted nucleic acid-binding protein